MPVWEGGTFICLPARSKSSHGLCSSSSLCQRVPCHFRWQWNPGMAKHHRCRCFYFSLCAQTEWDRDNPHPATTSSTPTDKHTHTSAFSTHPTANALWVILELEHGRENLWMSLYTYMDDKDAVWVPLAWWRYIGQEREEQCKENSK